jgi:tRNA pseudouridine55 synthase
MKTSPPMTPPERSSGLLLVDKPATWTSHDVVARVRRLAGTRKVGHAGTLDPMATGLLVLGIGGGTRLLTYLTGCDKQYRATVRLGAATNTDDADGEAVAQAPAAVVGALTGDVVRAAMAGLTGEIPQVPSAFSAIKVNGQRAYALARAGKDVELAARPVRVDRFEALGWRRGVGFSGQTRERLGLVGEEAYLDVDVMVECSAGTYVRALARDLGAALGVGGHLTALRRLRVGNYDVADAQTLEEMERGVTVTPLAEAARARFECRELTAEETQDVGYGRLVAPLDGVSGTRAEPVAAFTPDGRLAALLVDVPAGSRPVVVFPA